MATISSWSVDSEQQHLCLSPAPWTPGCKRCTAVSRCLTWQAQSRRDSAHTRKATDDCGHKVWRTESQWFPSPFFLDFTLTVSCSVSQADSGDVHLLNPEPCSWRLPLWCIGPSWLLLPHPVSAPPSRVTGFMTGSANLIGTPCTALLLILTSLLRTLVATPLLSLDEWIGRGLFILCLPLLSQLPCLYGSATFKPRVSALTQ